MPVFDFRFVVDAPLEDIQAFHQSPEVLSQLTPPPLGVKVYQFGAMAEGMIARFNLGVGPFTIDWQARHEDVSTEGFTDVQVSGPLESWRHTHRFIPLSANRTEIWEHIEYEYPPGWKGWAARLLFAKPALCFLFSYRKWVTRRELRR